VRWAESAVADSRRDRGEFVGPCDRGEFVDAGDRGEVVDPHDRGEVVDRRNREEVVYPGDSGEFVDPHARNGRGHRTQAGMMPGDRIDMWFQLTVAGNDPMPARHSRCSRPPPLRVVRVLDAGPRGRVRWKP
jgi:hypothetical protein